MSPSSLNFSLLSDSSNQYRISSLLDSLVFQVMILVCCFLFVGKSEVKASYLPDSPLAWKNLKVSNHDVTTFSILRDKDGLMWFGTNDGLFFYEGEESHRIEIPELRAAQIFALCQYGDEILLGTNNGLLSYQPKGNVLTRPYQDTPSEIRCLLLNGEQLWIGSLHGLFLLNLKDGTIEDFSTELTNKSVYSLLRDSRGILYIGTYDGLYRFEANDKRMMPIKALNLGKENSSSVSSNSKNENRADNRKNIFVNCLVESPEGSNIYIGTENALYQYTIATDNLKNIPEFDGQVIKSLALTKSGQIIVGTDNGLHNYDGEKVRSYRHDSRQQHTISDNNIWCLTSDSDQVLWVGHEKGVSLASNSKPFRVLKISDLTNNGDGNDISVLNSDSKGNLWLGGTNGIIRLNTNKETQWYRHGNGNNNGNNSLLSHNRIRHIFEDSNSDIWLSTDAGLNRFDSKNNRFDNFIVTDNDNRHPSNWVYSMAETKDGYWVASFLGGLHFLSKDKFDSNSRMIRADFSLNSESADFKDVKIDIWSDLINRLVVDDNDNLWVLTFRDYALFKITPSGESTRYDINELTGGYPTEICKDSDGNIWCAYEKGLLKLAQDGSTFNVKIPHINSDNSITAIAAVKDKIWATTFTTVWEIDCATLEAIPVALPQKHYLSILYNKENQKVILGESDQITEVDLSKLEEDEISNVVKVAYLFDDKGEIDLSRNYAIGGSKQDPIVVPSGGNLSLIISALDYTPETTTRYCYSVSRKGVEELQENESSSEWIVMPQGANVISLSKLSMGNYFIKVKPIDSTEQRVIIPLKVKAPWILSPLAILIYMVVLALIITLIIFYMRQRNIKVLREEQRRKALESAERKLSFLSDISHDLKTPLSMIMGPVSLLKENAKDENQKKSLEVVYENAVRLNNLIHKTLELKQLDHLTEDKDTLLIISTFDVVEFCRSLMDTFRENNANKRFVFYSSQPQILIEADAVKFESVITNLLSNACKYSEDNSTISCCIATDKDKDKVQIIVSDDGFGIPEQDKSLVFQRLYRSPSTAKAKEGTGIGLYLIKKYLEMMSGTIDMVSTQDQGTTFITTLPISAQITDNQLIPSSNDNPISSKENAIKAAEALGSQKNKPKSKDDKDKEDKECDGKPKILIVEDNKQISSFLLSLLDSDYCCLTAENGRAGLSLASSFLPDLIIMDELMPIMKGTEMARKLKLDPRLKHIPIIMLTAKADNLTENESVKLGVDIFMSKPFEPSVLLGRISHLLQTRQQMRESLRIESLTEVKPIEAESLTEKQLTKIAKVIEDNIADPALNVNMVAEKADIPNKQLYRILKKHTGMSPLEYIRNVRLQKAAMLLTQHRFTMAEVSFMVGFKTPSYFAKCFQEEFGVLPSQYSQDKESKKS